MALAQGLSSIHGRVRSFLNQDSPDLMAGAQKADDASVIAELDERYKKARDDRRQYESDWLTSLAFVRGQQWVEWSRQRQVLYAKPSPPWRIRVTVNLMQPIVRTLLGKIASQPAQGKVQAASDTPEAVQDARAQDELLEHLRMVCKSDETDGEAAKWMIIAGTGIHHLCWDKSIGDEVMEPDTIMADSIDPATGQPTQVEQPNPKAGQPVREAAKPPEDDEEPQPGAPVRMGEIDHIPVSPLQFFPEPMARTIDNMEWCFYVSVRPASYVQRKYGQEVEEERISADDFLQVSPEEQIGQPKGVVVKTYWERPNAENTEGRYVVFAGDKVLVNTKNPYPKFPLPFIIEKDPIIPDSFWGRSIMADLVPLQRAYNKLKSQAAEIRESTARPKWHVFKGALDPDQAITTAPAEVIVTNYLSGVPDGGRPTKILGGDVPASYQAEASSLQSQFFEVSGLRDPANTHVRSMMALKMILQEDETRVGVLKKEHDKATLATEAAMLKLAKQFYIEPRTVTVVGPDQTVEVHQFYSEKISDDPQVRMVASGNMPSSMSERRDYVMNLRKEGILTDPRSVRKLLDLGDVDGVNDDIEIDYRQAERENEQMKAGQVPQAHDYDNHIVHGQEHDSYRKGEEYEQVAASNPTVAQAFVQHVAQHKQLVQQAVAQAQASATPPTPGMPPAPAPAPAPAPPPPPQ